MVKSSYYKTTSPYQTKGINKEIHRKGQSFDSIRVGGIGKFIAFCKAYGSIFAYYGAGFGAFFSALWVAFFNELVIAFHIKYRYEGGCKFPYLSEVARNGFGWASFFIGTTIGCLPWILFSFDYYNAFRLLSMSIDNSCKRNLYIWRQRVYTCCLL